MSPDKVREEKGDKFRMGLVNVGRTEGRRRQWERGENVGMVRCEKKTTGGVTEGLKR